MFCITGIQPRYDPALSTASVIPTAIVSLSRRCLPYSRQKRPFRLSILSSSRYPKLPPSLCTLLSIISTPHSICGLASTRLITSFLLTLPRDVIRNTNASSEAPSTFPTLRISSLPPPAAWDSALRKKRTLLYSPSSFLTRTISFLPFSSST